MDGSKKKYIWIALAILIIAGPPFLLSNYTMRYWIRSADENPAAESSRSTLLRVGAICGMTFRPEIAAEAYSRFVERYSDDPRRPEAQYELGLALDEVNRSREGLDLLQRLVEEFPSEQYPQHAKLMELASKAIYRIQYVPVRGGPSTAE